MYILYIPDLQMNIECIHCTLIFKPNVLSFFFRFRYKTVLLADIRRSTKRS